MDRAHWGLTQTPFRFVAGAAGFQSPAAEEAVARLLFLVEERRRLAIVLGQAAGGKTTLLVQLAAALRRSGSLPVLANAAGIDDHELVWRLAAELGAAPETEEPIFRLWRRLTDRLAELRYQRIRAVLLIDDADRASAEVLSALARILQFAPAADCPHAVILCGNETGRRRLDALFAEAADLCVTLPAWDEEDTASYIRQSLEAAGASPEIFQPEAIAVLHALSGGSPRRANLLADLALLAGAAQQAEQIDAATVEAVFGELGFAEATLPG